MFKSNEKYCNENYPKTVYDCAGVAGLRLGGRGYRYGLGFTLVELLVVVAIIGILAALITAAAFRVIATTRVTTTRMKINDIEVALEMYKNKFGEYPPMISDTDAVNRHIKKRWPRYAAGTIPTAALQETFVENGTNHVYYKDSLVFWLGGFKNSDGKYCGFSVDKSNPFSVVENGASALYDNEVVIELSTDNVMRDDPTGTDHDHLRVHINMGSKGYPVIYFRGRKGGGQNAYRHKYYENASHVREWDDGRSWLIWQETTTCEIASPYYKRSGVWHNPETFQLIHPGADGVFGTTASTDRITDGSALSDGDYDNITNLGGSTIEALLP
jgi:prepilin-type N-terminal cleavage/methylation domain-containing protein